MITPTQCRMARIALNWTAKELAEKAKVGVATVNRFESGQVAPIKLTLEAMQRALEAAGVRFTEDGGVIPPALSS
jgi:transcriptional regulator with XRE-family HTH domain